MTGCFRHICVPVKNVFCTNCDLDRFARGSFIMFSGSLVDFWGHNVRNLTSNKASNSTCIEAVTGEQNVADY